LLEIQETVAAVKVYSVCCLCQWWCLWPDTLVVLLMLCCMFVSVCSDAW